MKNRRALIIGRWYREESLDRPLMTQVQGSGLQGDLHRLHSCGGGKRQRRGVSSLHDPPLTSSVRWIQEEREEVRYHS